LPPINKIKLNLKIKKIKVPYPDDLEIYFKRIHNIYLLNLNFFKVDYHIKRFYLYFDLKYIND